MRKLTVIWLVAAVSVACGAFAASASATSFVLRGAGWGHGIGMSQYGAQGFAKKGSSYKKILTHYYSGTDISSADRQTIKVILRLGPSTFKFSGATSASGGVTLAKGTTYTARRYGSGTRLLQGSKVLKTYSGPFTADAGTGTIKLTGKAINGLSNGRYRGTMVFSASDLGGLAAVNALSIDEYVQGVVPGEIPTSWHREALRAQAVAARSYALTTDAGGALFDQWPDTRSQMYRGVNAETEATNSAVSATAGEVVKYKGKVATTYFFSTSGGRTENVENVWNAKPIPYLKSVDDPYDDASPYHRWSLRMSRATLQRKLGGYVKGTLKNVKVTKRGVSPRVVTARVIGTRGSKTIKGAELRSRLGLRDTWVSFKRVR